MRTLEPKISKLVLTLIWKEVRIMGAPCAGVYFYGLVHVFGYVHPVGALFPVLYRD